jgi:hypothetical protein
MFECTARAPGRSSVEVCACGCSVWTQKNWQCALRTCLWCQYETGGDSFEKLKSIFQVKLPSPFFELHVPP